MSIFKRFATFMAQAYGQPVTTQEYQFGGVL
jgi:hypothetical protein